MEGAPSPDLSCPGVRCRTRSPRRLRAGQPRARRPADRRSLARRHGGSAAALRELAHWPEVSAALTVVPYYTRPSQEGVVAHFTQLAAVSPVPLIVYNVPDRTGTPLTGQTLLRLASLPGIAGIKQAAGDIDQDTVTLMAECPANFAVLAGTTRSHPRSSRSGPRRHPRLRSSAHRRLCRADRRLAFPELLASTAARASPRPALGGAFRRAEPGRDQGRPAGGRDDPQPHGATAPPGSWWRVGECRPGPAARLTRRARMNACTFTRRLSS